MVDLNMIKNTLQISFLFIHFTDIGKQNKENNNDRNSFINIHSVVELFYTGCNILFEITKIVNFKLFSIRRNNSLSQPIPATNFSCFSQRKVKHQYFKVIQQVTPPKQLKNKQNNHHDFVAVTIICTLAFRSKLTKLTVSHYSLNLSVALDLVGLRSNNNAFAN